MDNLTMKWHGIGCDVMGRGTGIADSLKALADSVDAIHGEDVPDSMLIALGRVAEAFRERENAADERDKRYRAVSLDLNAMAAAFRLPDSSVLSGSPFPHARLMATHAAVAASGTRVAENAAAFVNNALSFHDAAVREMNASREATRELHALTAANSANAAALENALSDCRHLTRSYASAADRVAKAEGERDAAKMALGALVRELGGLSLSMLPHGAYGPALVAAFNAARKESE